MKTFFAACAVATGMLLGAPAEACDCPLEPPIEVAMEKSNAVVRARVVKVGDFETYRDGGTVGTTGRRTIQLRVVKAWRGEMAPGATFDVVLEGSDCDHGFVAPGEEHVLYLVKNADAFVVPACGRSLLLGPQGETSGRSGASEIAQLDKLVAKNQARWGAAPVTSSSSAPPSAPTKSGGCAGCSTSPASFDAGWMGWIGALGLVVAARRVRPSRRASSRGGPPASREARG